MTKLYRFGFGGFDEKPTPPFDSFHTDGRDYDFRHVQSMTKETDKVAKILIKPRPKRSQNVSVDHNDQRQPPLGRE